MMLFLEILVIVLTISVLFLLYQNSKVVKLNYENQQINRDLEKDISYAKQELEGTLNLTIEKKEEIEYLDKEIQIRQEQSGQIEQHNQEIIQSYKKQMAQQIELINSDYEQKIKDKEQEIKNFETKIILAQESFNAAVAQLDNEIDNHQIELDKIKATRHALQEAARREELIKDKINNYRLNLTDEELEDIKYLENLKYKISKPDIISKLIWTHYYQPLAKQKFMTILNGGKEVCGIYKITSILDGSIYIGQSKDCYKRWNEHCKNALGASNTKGVNKLYKTIKEQGLNNFTFELLENCSVEQLDEKEKFYIDLYDSANFGLNTTKGNSTN